MLNEKELQELKLAAECGIPKAQMALGNHYNELGDELEAIKWYSKANLHVNDVAERAVKSLIENMETAELRISTYLGESARRWLLGVVPHSVPIEGQHLINTEFRRVKITSYGGNSGMPGKVKIRPLTGVAAEKRLSPLNPDWADETNVQPDAGSLNCPRVYTLMHKRGLGIFGNPDRISVDFFEHDIQQIKFVRDARRGRRTVTGWPFLCRYEIEIQLSDKDVTLRYDPPFANGFHLSRICHTESVHVSSH